MNELIKILAMVAVCLSAILIASIADDRIKSGDYRVTTIVFIGIVTGLILRLIVVYLKVV